MSPASIGEIFEKLGMTLHAVEAKALFERFHTERDGEKGRAANEKLFCDADDVTDYLLSCQSVKYALGVEDNVFK